MKLISWIFIVNQILFTVIMTNSYMLSSSSFENDENYVANNFELNETLNRIKKSIVIKKTKLLWNDGIIPYEFDNVYNGSQRRLILQAMRRWEASTCIKFVKRNKTVHRSYLFFIKMDCGCCSTVGKLNYGKNIISIDDECSRFGTILHELGHAIGLLHEHVHPDRDDYVQINFGNIPDADKYLFKKLDPAAVDTLGQPYDYGSIMHYPGLMQTIVPLQKINGNIPEIGQRIKLSEGDVLAANLLYNCSKCGGKTFSSPKAVISSNNSTSSYNYCLWSIRAAAGEDIQLDIKLLDIYNSTDCNVKFLEIRNGYQKNSPVLARYCKKLETHTIIASDWITVEFARIQSEDSSLGFSMQYQSLCGGIIDIESNRTHYLESPNYPEDYPPYKQCEWYIRAPYKHYLLIKFDYFELENSEMCINDFMEAREGKNENAPLIGTYCGKEENLEIASLMRRVYLMFLSNGLKQAGGFSAVISAVPIKNM